MMMQLNPPLPVDTPRGAAYAHMVIDYSQEHYVLFVCFLQETGECWVLPNRDVWTFEALDDKVDLEDSVFLAGNDGPRRTAQIVIRQDARHTSSVRWSFTRSSTSATATKAGRNARREPELPL